MKRNYQSGAHKRQAKRRKIAEAATNSQRLSLWLTRPKTFKADEQDVSICETESTPQLSTIVPMKKIPWTSYALQNPWGTTGLNDWRHLSQRNRSHEISTRHAQAMRRREIEAMKSPHVMRRRVSYMSNGETGRQ